MVLKRRKMGEYDAKMRCFVPWAGLCRHPLFSFAVLTTLLSSSTGCETDLDATLNDPATDVSANGLTMGSGVFPGGGLVGSCLSDADCFPGYVCATGFGSCVLGIDPEIIDEVDCNECATVGQMTCAAKDVLQCTVNANQCRVWQRKETCTTACSDGACVPHRVIGILERKGTACPAPAGPLFPGVPTNSELSRFCLYESTSNGALSFPSNNTSKIVLSNPDPFQSISSGMSWMNEQAWTDVNSVLLDSANRRVYASSMKAGEVIYYENARRPRLVVIGDRNIAFLGQKVAEPFVCKRGKPCIAEMYGRSTNFGNSTTDARRISQLAQIIVEEVQRWKSNKTQTPVLSIAILSSLMEIALSNISGMTPYRGNASSLTAPQQALVRALEFASCEGAFVSTPILSSYSLNGIRSKTQEPFTVTPKAGLDYCNAVFNSSEPSLTSSINGNSPSQPSSSLTPPVVTPVGTTELVSPFGTPDPPPWQPPISEDGFVTMTFYPIYIASTTESSLPTVIADLFGTTVGLSASVAKMFYYNPGRPMEKALNDIFSSKDPVNPFCLSGSLYSACLAGRGQFCPQTLSDFFNPKTIDHEECIEEECTQWFKCKGLYYADGKNKMGCHTPGVISCGGMCFPGGGLTPIDRINPVTIPTDNGNNNEQNGPQGNPATTARSAFDDSESVCANVGDGGEYFDVNNYENWDLEGVPKQFVLDHKGPVGVLVLEGLLSRDEYAKYCTGTLIGPSTFLTSSLCLSGWNPKDGLRLVVKFNFEKDGNSGNILPTLRSYVEWNSFLEAQNENSTTGYTLLTLTENPGHTYGWTGVSDKRPENGHPVVVIQHPYGEEKKVHAGNVRAVEDSGLGYWVSTEFGSTGAGVLNSEGKIVAVNREKICEVNGRCYGKGARISTSALLSARPDLEEYLGGCQPSCINKQCGSNRCGGTCPPGCGENSVCTALGQCCQPRCTACGKSDGCGGTCGCPTGSRCYVGQCCQPQCADKQCGDDGCGGSCGICATDQKCVWGTCELVEPLCKYPQQCSDF